MTGLFDLEFRMEKIDRNGSCNSGCSNIDQIVADQYGRQHSRRVLFKLIQGLRAAAAFLDQTLNPRQRQ